MAHAGREQAGGHGGQAFGDGGDAERHGGAQQRQQSPAAQQAQAQHTAAQQTGTDGQAAAERVQLLLQPRTGRFGGLGELTDPAELGALCRGDHQRAASAARDGRAQEHHVVPLGQRRAGRQRIHRLLGHRQAFAGQRRLVGRQPVRLDHPRVGGDRLARLQQQHVADHHVARVDAARPAVAQHAGSAGLQPAQAGDRLLRLALGDEADRTVGRQDRGNGAGVEDGPHRQRDRGRCAQQRHRNRIELPGEDLPRAAAGNVADLVRAIASQTPRRLGGGQAAPQVDRSAMPVRHATDQK